VPCIQQVGDLETSGRFRNLGIQLISISPDPPEAWDQVAEEYDLDTPLVTDPRNEVARQYGVMEWRIPPEAPVESAEPGHTFVLVDEQGIVEWVRDYGAPENGGVMYVFPDALIRDMPRSSDVKNSRTDG
jgi:peroxiredoxin